MSVRPQGIHSIIALDLIHLQKSLGGCKAWIVASYHEKASFPPILHTDKKMSHLHSMWESQLSIRMWDRGALAKNKHSPWMNIYVCLALNVLSFSPSERGQANIRLWGLATHPTLERDQGVYINVFFLRNCYSVDHELSLFIGAHRILVWNEVKISRLKRDSFEGSLPWMSVEVCCGDPNKSAFEGSQGWTRRTGKQAQADFSRCQRICMSELVLSFSQLITCFSAFWALCSQGYASS